MHHLVFGINFQIHFVTLAGLVSIHLLIHLSNPSLSSSPSLSSPITTSVSKEEGAKSRKRQQGWGVKEGGGGSPPQKKPFCPQNDKSVYILTMFLTGRKHGQSLEALGHECYGSIAKLCLQQKQCKNYQSNWRSDQREGTRTIAPPPKNATGFSLSLQAQNLPFQQILSTLIDFWSSLDFADHWTGPDLSWSSVYFWFIFLVNILFDSVEQTKLAIRQFLTSRQIYLIVYRNGT